LEKGNGKAYEIRRVKYERTNKYTVSFERVNYIMILLKIHNHQKFNLGQSGRVQKRYLEHSSSIIERDNRDQVTQQS
jgi:hypothetical protein